jgi:hypothetical protein
MSENDVQQNKPESNNCTHADYKVVFAEGLCEVHCQSCGAVRICSREESELLTNTDHHETRLCECCGKPNEIRKCRTCGSLVPFDGMNPVITLEQLMDSNFQ